MGHTTIASVDLGTPQVFFCNRFICDGLDGLRASHKHVARVFDHENEICHGQAVDGPTGTGSHDQHNLGNDPGGIDIS
jgi:hypothetical protein